MRLFQRFEFWLLLALAAGAGLFVLLTQKPREVELVSQSVPTTVQQPGVVEELTLTRDHGNVRLDIGARLTNSTARDLQLVSLNVALRGAKGREVPLFFLPSQPPPKLPAQSTSQVLLRFWLESEDLAGSLVLEFMRQRMEIKSAKPYSLDALKNGEPLSLMPSNW
jgi:hypothetical protein